MDRTKTVGVVVLFVLAIAWASVSMIRPDAMVSILDVGQGDAIFITTSSGEDVLIDGGPNGQLLEHLGGMLPLTDRDIELMVLTHPHADHLSGLIDVVQRYNVQRIVCACKGGESQTFEKWRQEAGYDAPIENLDEVTEIIFIGGAKLTIWPPPEGKSLNDQSLVSLFEDTNKSFLFTGDAEIPSEEWLLEENYLQDVDVLKVGHHGSRSSTTEAFLGAITPEIGVISVGENNRYGHPHGEILKRLQDHEVQIHRTDQDGSIIFWLYKGEWRLSTLSERLMPLIVDLWYNSAT